MANSNGEQTSNRPPHPWTQRLRRARKDESLEAVAKRAGVAPSTVQNLERGNGTLASVRKVALALGIPLVRLFWRPIRRP